MAGSSAGTGASIYPAWYSQSGDFVAADSIFAAHGMAIGADSATAIRKATMKAKANFTKYLSNRLESIRDDAVDELGESSGLESTSFIFALRKAEGAISEATTIQRQEAKPNSGFSSYQGFSSVTMTREQLISSLGDRLDGNRSAWEALRSSQAFEDL